VQGEFLTRQAHAFSLCKAHRTDSKEDIAGKTSCISRRAFYASLFCLPSIYKLKPVPSPLLISADACAKTAPSIALWSKHGWCLGGLPFFLCGGDMLRCCL